MSSSRWSYNSQILEADYEIQNFKNVNPKKDPYIANWNGNLYESNSNSNTDDSVSGFFKVSKKGKLKIYLDNGDGVLSSKDDTLLSKVSLSKYDRTAMSLHKKGKYSIEYNVYSYLNNKGKTVQDTIFNSIISKEYDLFIMGSIDTKTGLDEFSKYMNPCISPDI